MVELSIDRVRAKSRVSKQNNCTDCQECPKTSTHAPSASAPWLPIVGGGAIGSWLSGLFGGDNGDLPIDVPSEVLMIGGAALGIVLVALLL